MNDIIKLYQEDIAVATGESLFGSNEDISPLPPLAREARYYVGARVGPSGRPIDESSESRFYNFIEIGGTTKPLVIVIGGEGSGKSTFLRHFFRYYLPNKAHLDGEVGDLAGAYEGVWRRHIILYCDLHHADSLASIIELMLRSFAKCMTGFINREGLSSLFPAAYCSWTPGETFKTVEEMRCVIGLLAEQRTGGINAGPDEPRFFVSCIFDNLDTVCFATAEEGIVQVNFFRWLQRELLTRPESNLGGASFVPNRDHRMVWRVICPMRPETYSFYEQSTTADNDETFDLPNVKQDILISRRSAFLKDRVSQSKIPFNEDVYYLEEVKPWMRTILPGESGDDLSSVFRCEVVRDAAELNKDYSASMIDQETKEILDLLANQSCRRRIWLHKRGALSKVVWRRYREGKPKGWKHPITTFVFFLGLLCGDKDHFSQEDSRNHLIDLYRCGGEGSGIRPSGHALLVGAYAAKLLQSGKSWPHACQLLERMGFTSDHISQCETAFRKARLLRFVPLFPKGHSWTCEINIVKGFCTLMVHRAYTECMTYDCADTLGIKDVEPPSPLDVEKIVPRMEGCVRFLEKVVQAEIDVWTYPKEWQNPEGEPIESAVEYETWKRALRDHGHHVRTSASVVKEYLERLESLPKSGRVADAVRKENKRWESGLATLRKILTAACQIEIRAQSSPSHVRNNRDQVTILLPSVHSQSGDYSV